MSAIVAVAALPLLVRALFPASEKYYLHLLIQILLWSFIYTGWSLMGRFGLTSLGHGAFTGIGAYATVLLWNYAGITPWIGIPVGVLLATIVGVLVGYPCFRLRITGHYFALLTLALTEFVRLCIVGLRDYTGGSLGTQPSGTAAASRSMPCNLSPTGCSPTTSLLPCGYSGSTSGCVSIAAWTATRSMPPARMRTPPPPSVSTSRREKLKITALSSAMCALGGAFFAQYQMYIGPDTIAGLGVSLNIVFAVIAGGLYVMLGPTVGAVFTQLLAEGLRVVIQGSATLRGLIRQFGPGPRSGHLWAAADPVHHLYAKGYSRHRHRMVAAAQPRQARGDGRCHGVQGGRGQNPRRLRSRLAVRVNGPLLPPRRR